MCVHTGCFLVRVINKERERKWRLNVNPLMYVESWWLHAYRGLMYVHMHTHQPFGCQQQVLSRFLQESIVLSNVQMRQRAEKLSTAFKLHR